jgi:nitrogen fixation-related uncharacterized protein
MNILQYVIGVFVYAVVIILYAVFKSGGINLNQATLIEIAIQAVLAGLSFFLVDYLINRNK